MKEIDYPDMRRANNGAHGMFMKSVSERLEKESEVMKNAVMQRAAMALKAAMEEESLYLGRSLTDEIKTADKERDGLLTGLRATVRGLRRLPDPEKAKAAQELEVMLSGNRVKRSMQLERETGRITKLTEELETTYASQVSLLSIGLFVSGLKAANERVKGLIDERSNGEVERKPAAMQQARLRTDAAFRQVARVANAMAVLEDEAVVAPFINFVNELVRRYRQQVFPKRKKKAESTKTENA